MTNQLFLVLVFALVRTSFSSNILWARRPYVPPCGHGGSRLRLSETGHKPSPGACASHCHHTEWCDSFLYTPSNSTCTLCPLHYVDGDDTGGDVTRYYRGESDVCSLRDGYILDRAAHRCVLIVTTADSLVFSWYDANSACASLGMRLISMPVTSRLDFIMETLRLNPRYHGLDYFTGGLRPQYQWGYPWTDGVPEFMWLDDAAPVILGNTAYWASGQPDNVNNSDNVLILGGPDFLLRDDEHTSSRDRLGYICEQ